MLIWIRADGSEAIASGHLRRTLTIAEALQRKGSEVLFLLSEEESRDIFLHITDGNRAGWNYLILGCTYGDMEADLQRMGELLQAGAPDWVMVDSYAATPEYYERLREMARKAPAPASGSGCRIACLDDLMAFDPPVDLVINYAPDVICSEAFYLQAPRRLLGPQYAPLRRQFSGMEPLVREQVSRILITTGGSDPFGMADAAAQAVRSAADGALTESVTDRSGQGSSAPAGKRRTADAETIANGAAELVFAAPGHPYVSNMAALLKTCDLAVSAGGTTLYELCASGVPTIAFSMAQNQRIFAQRMAAAGACTYAGDVQDARERALVLQKIGGWITGHCNGAAGLALRRKESARMHALTDGAGADRIAVALLEGSDVRDE